MTALRVDDDLHASIESALARRFAERSTQAQAYGEEFAELWRLAASLALGGKLLRPAILIDTYDALAETSPATPVDRTTIIELAASVELLHYCFLLHDDVIDGDLMRRRSPNLISALRARHPRSHLTDEAPLHWGRSGAILMGDLLLAAVHQTFARADVEATTRLRLLDLLDHTVMESVAGEQTDVALSHGVISPDLRTILTMTAHKTATYSFELPLRAAAVLAGAAPSTETALTAAGRHLGLAFQLQDDLLSVFGDPTAHGKDAHSDLREGKETVIIAYARLTHAWPDIETGFADAELTVENAAEITAHLRACGAEDFTQRLIQEQLTAVYEVLAAADESQGVPASARAVVLALADRIEGRRS